MADIASTGAGRGVAFMVAGGLVYEIIAAACSSPQTTEINADKRSDTLMKWVYLGLAQAAVFIVIAALLSDHPLSVIGGGTLGGGLMLAQYRHAKASGLRAAGQGAPGTEG
jgi:hypothetical protein